MARSVKDIMDDAGGPEGFVANLSNARRSLMVSEVSAVDALLRFVEDGGKVAFERGQDQAVKMDCSMKANTGKTYIRSILLSSPDPYRFAGMQDRCVVIAIEDVREVVAKAESREVDGE